MCACACVRARSFHPAAASSRWASCVCFLFWRPATCVTRATLITTSSVSRLGVCLCPPSPNFCGLRLFHAAAPLLATYLNACVSCPGYGEKERGREDGGCVGHTVARNRKPPFPQKTNKHEVKSSLQLRTHSSYVYLSLTSMIGEDTEDIVSCCKIPYSASIREGASGCVFRARKDVSGCLLIVCGRGQLCEGTINRNREAAWKPEVCPFSLRNIYLRNTSTRSSWQHECHEQKKTALCVGAVS